MTRICDLVFAGSAARSLADWKAVVSEAVVKAGFSIFRDEDEVASLEASANPGHELRTELVAAAT